MIVKEKSNLNIALKEPPLFSYVKSDIMSVFKEEFETYAPLVSSGSYCVVFDSVIEDLPSPVDRPWGPGNSPKTALFEYLKKDDDSFYIDKDIEASKFFLAEELPKLAIKYL